MLLCPCILTQMHNFLPVHFISKQSLSWVKFSGHILFPSELCRYYLLYLCGKSEATEIPHPQIDLPFPPKCLHYSSFMLLTVVFCQFFIIHEMPCGLLAYVFFSNLGMGGVFSLLGYFTLPLDQFSFGEIVFHKLAYYFLCHLCLVAVRSSSYVSCGPLGADTSSTPYP